ncbi:MAG TPA: restriction endonuclease subunit S [Pirellulaceae bacterium]|jgi:type I restriction enzyme S subunit|nr:restriction endonuclease subunit S [Pirellulaceae bacterium]
MKNGWQSSILGDVLEVLRNGVNCKQNKSGNGDRISRIESISDASFDLKKIGFAELSERDKERFRLQKGDILFSHINSAIHVGKTAVFESDEAVYHGVNLLLMRPKDTVIPAFLEHALKFLFVSGYWRGVCKQSVNQASVNQKDISRVEFRYPKSLSEQRRIVGILDEALDGIATAIATAENNLQNARALFESHLNAAFTQRGDGWIHTTIGEQAVLQRGFDITKRQQNPGSIPVVSSGGIKSFHDKAMVDAPGVVIGRKGTLGKVFYLEDDYWPHDTTLWVKDFKGNDPRFVYYFFTGLDVLHLDSGAANPALNRNQVHPINVDWPPVSEQPTIVATLDALVEETQRLESIYQRKLDALDELKKSLLHQAFSGQL